MTASMFRQQLAQDFTWDDIEKEFSSAIFIVEHEMGMFIDEDYPAIKFHNQLEELTKYFKKQKKEADKARKRKR